MNNHLDILLNDSRLLLALTLLLLRCGDVERQPGPPDDVDLAAEAGVPAGDHVRRGKVSDLLVLSQNVRGLGDSKKVRHLSNREKVRQLSCEVLAIKSSVQKVQIVCTRHTTVPRVPLYVSMLRCLCVRVDLAVGLYDLGFSTLY